MIIIDIGTSVVDKFITIQYLGKFDPKVSYEKLIKYNPDFKGALSDVEKSSSYKGFVNFGEATYTICNEDLHDAMIDADGRCHYCEGTIKSKTN
jgi:hypothetical protein